MRKPQEEYVSVWRLAETDDWDGVAAVGKHHCTYLYVKCVLLAEDGGWWDDSYQPYLVFTNVECTGDEANRTVKKALESGESRCRIQLLQSHVRRRLTGRRRANDVLQRRARPGR